MSSQIQIQFECISTLQFASFWLNGIIFLKIHKYFCLFSFDFFSYWYSFFQFRWTLNLCFCAKLEACKFIFCKDLWLVFSIFVFDLIKLIFSQCLWFHTFQCLYRSTYCCLSLFFIIFQNAKRWAILAVSLFVNIHHLNLLSLSLCLLTQLWIMLRFHQWFTKFASCW